LPLTAEGSRRLEAWSSASGPKRLGIFLNGKLVAAPEIKSRLGGGIPLRVASKTEGDRVLKELHNGGVAGPIE
jgi:preprotein translocase subunit SecD